MSISLQEPEQTIIFESAINIKCVPEQSKCLTHKHQREDCDPTVCILDLEVWS